MKTKTSRQSDPDNSSPSDAENTGRNKVNWSCGKEQRSRQGRWSKEFLVWAADMKLNWSKIEHLFPNLSLCKVKS